MTIPSTAIAVVFLPHTNLIVELVRTLVGTVLLLNGDHPVCMMRSPMVGREAAVLIGHPLWTNARTKSQRANNHDYSNSFARSLLKWLAVHQTSQSAPSASHPSPPLSVTVVGVADVCFRAGMRMRQGRFEIVLGTTLRSSSIRVVLLLRNVCVRAGKESPLTRCS